MPLPVYDCAERHTLTTEVKWSSFYNIFRNTSERFPLSYNVLLSYMLIVFKYVKIFAKPDWVLILFILRYVMKCMGSLQWRHNESDGVAKHRRLHCLLDCWFRRRSKKTSKLRVTGLCAGNSPVTGEFLAQKASNAEIVSIWWRHHVYAKFAGRTIAVDSSQRVPLIRKGLATNCVVIGYVTQIPLITTEDTESCHDAKFVTILTSI